MRVIGRRLGHNQIITGTDRVVVGFPLPAGGRLNNIHLDIHLATYDVAVKKAVMYGITGFVVPLLDPDAVITYQDSWDTQIPKDVANAAGVFDLDTGATDSTPEFEVGEPDWSGVFKVTAGAPLEIFKRRKMMSFASSPVGHEGAAVDTYNAVDLVQTTIKRNVTVDTPSLILFGLSSPSMDVTGSDAVNSLLEKEWIQYQFLEDTLKDAWKHLVGLTETGAETPYVEAAALVAELIEAPIFEQTAGSFADVTWEAFAKATFDVTVPGTISIGTLTSD